jgi:hypothetical protein
MRWVFVCKYKRREGTFDMAPVSPSVLGHSDYTKAFADDKMTFLLNTCGDIFPEQ